MNKRILCFGDSITWGYSPDGITRFNTDTRWPGVMRKHLGTGFKVIEEGFCGRTTVYNDPIVPDRNGKDALPGIIQAHAPLDLIIIMLGTNDHKNCYHASSQQIARNINTLIEIIRSHEALKPNPPEILVIAPPPLVNMPETNFKESFTGSEEKSIQTGKEILSFFQDTPVHLFNAAAHITSSPRDGLHLDAEEQIKLGTLLASEVKQIFQRD